MHRPYFSHKLCNDVHVLLGFTSKILPSKGIPGGCGIGAVIAMLSAKKDIWRTSGEQRLSRKRKTQLKSLSVEI